jgi:TonB family protein
MTPFKRRWLSGLLAVGLMLVLVSVVWLDGQLRFDPPEVFALTEVNIYEPPPPPPQTPPRDVNSSRRSGPALSRAIQQQSLELELMELEVALALGDSGDLGSGGWGIGDGVGEGLEAVDLSALDKAPVLMGSPPIVYPEVAIEQGVEEFEVVVQILVDEEGRTYPIRILQSPFPSFNQDIMEFAAGVVFSPPTSLGVPVRTEYAWPLLIKR